MQLEARTTSILILMLGALSGCGADSPSGGADGSGGSSSQSTSSASSSAATTGSSGSGGEGGSGTGGAGGGGGAGGATPTIDCSGETILHYEFHNQIVGSSLDITKAGALTHVEHDCCPPADHPIEQEPLSAQALTDLLARIEAASQGSLHVEEGLPTAEGSLSGTLQACTEAGVGVILRDVARDDAGGNDIVTVNDAAEAQQILDLVEDMVAQDMY